MTRNHRVRARAGAFAQTVVALRRSPIPRSAMLRSGGAIGFGFLFFFAAGRIEAAIVCAIFTNFLCLCDRATSLATRIWVQILGALLSVAAAAMGTLVAGDDALILVTTFAFALFAGFVHGTLPGVEAIPRYALVCFVIAAFLPVAKTGTLVAVALATVLAVVTVLLDHRIRHGRRGPDVRDVRAGVTLPGPRFGVIFGLAAVIGLALGMVCGQPRPYWVAITTLLVMQPDRRANAVRVVQRLLGTLCGVLMAFLVVESTPPREREEVLLLLVLTMPFIWPLGFERNYALGTAVLSTWVLIIIEMALPGAERVTPLFLARLSDTTIGCAIALLGSLAVSEMRGEGTAGRPNDASA